MSVTPDQAEAIRDAELPDGPERTVAAVADITIKTQ